MAMVRDFMYLDLLRLRSLSSQFLGGVPESQTMSSEQAVGAGGDISGGLFGLAKAGASTDIRSTAASAETASIHHHLFSRFIEELERRRIIHSTDVADDGDFVHVSGTIQLSDPAALVAVMEKLPAMKAALLALERINAAAQGSPTTKSGSAIAKDWPSPQQIKPIKELIELLAPESVQLRVFDADRPLAFGLLDRSGFTDPLWRATSRHGNRTREAWHVMGQFNVPGQEPLRSQGTSLVEMIENALTVHEALQGVVYPQAGGVPHLTIIAVYREIAHV